MRITNLKKAGLRIYCRFIKLKGEPRQIALGFSLGVMIGMTPFFGAHILSSLVIASFLGWSKIAAMIGVNITNVMTIPIIYPINYWVGAKLLGTSRSFKWPENMDVTAVLELIKQSPMVLMNLFVGGVVVGLPLAVGGYFFVVRAVRLYCNKREIKSNHHRLS
jgi:uncharacterized protein (DUF2062 family)